MKIILPSFYNAHNYNLKLIEKHLFKQNIVGVSGSFPFGIFNGGYNNIKNSHLVLIHDIIQSIKSYGAFSNMVVIDFGSLCLEETDFYDCFNTVVLEQYAASKNIYFSVASEPLVDFLIKNYPDIQLILHTNYVNFHSEQEVADILNRYPNNFHYLTITPNNECLNITNIQKIYSIPFTFCYCCPQYQKCIQMDNNYQLEYSIESQFRTCQFKKYLNSTYINTVINHAAQITDMIMFEDILIEDNEKMYEMLANEILEGEII